MDRANLIGNRINEALALRDAKQKDLAKSLGVKDNVISYWCSGSRIPNTQQIIQISKKLNVSADFLLGLSDVATSDRDLQFVCDYTGLNAELAEHLNAFINTLRSKYGQNSQECNYKLDFLNCFISLFFSVEHWLDFLKLSAENEKLLLNEYSDIIDSAYEELRNLSTKADLNAYNELLDKVLNHSSGLDRNDIEYNGTIYKLQSAFADFLLGQIGAEGIKDIIREVGIKEQSFIAHVDKLKQQINSN